MFHDNKSDSPSRFVPRVECEGLRVSRFQMPPETFVNMYLIVKR